MDDIIRLASVSKRYGSVQALRDVTLGFAAGSFTAVMGPSGSGKSTLLQCVAGLERPDSGSIRIAGIELTGLRETRLTKLRRTHIGFVFQSFNLLPRLTAAQNVALPLRLAGVRVKGVDEALAEVGLADRAGHRPSQLSGGQQQRVAIARALVTKPAVLFADEPTGALDTENGRQILQMLRALAGQTIIMVTHDPVAAAQADRVVFFRDGRPAGEVASPTPSAVSEFLASTSEPAC